MSRVVCLRFPHASEMRWMSEWPSVGEELLSSGQRWIVLAETEENGCPVLVLEPVAPTGGVGK
jgi:hypothetical protein